MQHDDKCDSECNNEACAFDSSECLCNAGCTPSAKRSCAASCLVQQCYYGDYKQADGCNDQFLFTYAFYRGIASNSTSTAYDINDCFSTTKACTMTMLQRAYNENVCMMLCNTRECAFSFGRCNQGGRPNNCEFSYAPFSGSCLNCNLAYKQYLGSCISECPRGFAVGTKIPIYCLGLPDDGMPDVLYVTDDGGFTDSSNTVNFKNLMDAFASAWKKHTVIYVQGKEATFNPSFAYSHSSYVNYAARPSSPNMLAEGGWKNMTIQGVGCTSGCTETRTVLHFMNIITHWIEGREITFRNFVITTRKYFQYEDVKYCPYFTSVPKGYNNQRQFFNDRGEAMPHVYWDLVQCKYFASKSLFIVKDGGKLNWIVSDRQDISVEDFTIQLQAVIAIEGGDVNFSNVNFTNVQPSIASTLSAIILQSASCTSLLSCGSFTYDQGVVSNMNNGYEFRSDLVLNPFMSAGALYSISITRVKFEYIMVVSPGAASGILVLSDFQTLLLEDCVFVNNYVTGSVVSIDSSVSLPRTIDSHANAIAFQLTHVQVENCVFVTNFATGGILTIVFAGDLQNVRIANSSFAANSLGSGDVLSITNDLNLTAEAVTGGYSDEIGGYLSARQVNITNVTFVDHTSFASIISFTNVANVRIEQTAINRNGRVETNWMQALADAFVNSPGIYATKAPTYGADIPCDGLIDFLSTRNTNMLDVNITSNICTQGGTGIYYSETAGVNAITRLLSAGNVAAKDTGAVLDCHEGTEVVVTDLTARDNNHTDRGLIYMRTGGSLELKHAHFLRNFGFSGTCVYADGATKITVDGSLFEDNKAPLSSGGVLMLVPNATGVPVLSVTNSVFRRNSAQRGGAFAIFFYLSGDPLLMTLSGNTFESNVAGMSGSSLYTGSTVRFTSLSKVVACAFTGEQGSAGVLGLMHVEGNLLITQSTFRNNAGQVSSGIYLQTGETSITTIKDVTFTSHITGPVIAKPNSRIFSTFTTEDCKFIDNNSPSVFMESGKWQDFRSEFRGSTITPVQLTSEAIAVITSGRFIGNHCKDLPGAVSLQSSSNLTCTTCEFTENNSTSNGGAVFVEQNSFINFTHCSFQRNKATQSGSALYFLSAETPRSVVENTDFVENEADETGTVSIQSSELDLRHVRFHRNRHGGTPGIALILSKIWVTNGEFLEQSGKEAAFMSVQITSEAYVTKTSFASGSGEQAGGIYISSSILSVSDCSFSSISGASSGLLYAGSHSAVGLSDITAYNMTSQEDGSLVLATDSTLEIERAEFIDYGAGGVLGTLMQLISIADSVFENGRGNEGVAVYCSDCLAVSIKSSKFSNHTGATGTIWLKTGDTSTVLLDAEIEESVFTNNTMQKSAGAVYASNINLAINQSLFSQNQAAEQDAGAVFLGCSSLALCSYSIFSTHFELNSASRAGGAVYWKPVQPQMDGNVTYDQNTAFYGNDTASFPVRILIEAGNAERKLSEADEVYLEKSTAPGQMTEFVMNVSLLDHYGQVVRTDSSSNAELIASTGSKDTVSGSVKVPASFGVFTFDNFIIYADPGTEASLTVTTDAIAVSETNTDNSTYASRKIIVPIRNCVPGESQAPQSCLVCSDKTYSFDPSLPCQNCLDHTDCLGNMTVVPQPGYWRPGIYSERVFECPRKSSCLGGQQADGSNNISYTGFCADGYTGHMCQMCINGYFLSGVNLCQKCPSPTNSIVQSVFIYIGIFIFIAILVWSSLRSSLRAAAVHSIYLKILVNYSQLVFLVADFKLNWPDEVLSLFEVQKSAGGATDIAISVDCFYRDSGNTNENFFRKRIFAVLLPILGLLVALIIWLPVALIARKMSYMRRQFAATIVIIFFFIHPTLVRSLFSLFSCTELEKGEYWLTDNLNVQCWTGDHLIYSTTLGIAGILVWIIGVPFLCLGILVKYRENQKEQWLKQTYGFLINGYRHSRFYWEFVILYRKIAIICCSVFFTGVYMVQALTVLVILLFYLFLQYRIHPYTTGEMNRMELAAILVACTTIYSGLFFLSNDLNDGGTWLFFICICLANFLFLFYWVMEMLRYIIGSRLHKADGTLFRVSHLDPDEEIEKGMKHAVSGMENNPFPYRAAKDAYRAVLSIPLRYDYLPDECMRMCGYRRISSVGEGTSKYISAADESELEHLGRSFKNPIVPFNSIEASKQSVQD